MVDNQESKNLFLAGVCYKMEGKWMFKSGSGFVLESARQVSEYLSIYLSMFWKKVIEIRQKMELKWLLEQLKPISHHVIFYSLQPLNLSTLMI